MRTAEGRSILLNTLSFVQNDPFIFADSSLVRLGCAWMRTAEGREHCFLLLTTFLLPLRYFALLNRHFDGSEFSC